jgi:hypothetical protein
VREVAGSNPVVPTIFLTAAALGGRFSLRMNRGPTNTKCVSADVAVLGCFLVSGSISGLLFAFLVSRPSLQSFFFFKSDKFLIPRYPYWCSLSLVQLFGLTAAYLVCVARRLLLHPVSQLRLVSAALTIALAAPILYLSTPVMNSHIGLEWDFILAPLVFLFLLSCALCISSGNPKLLPIAIVWICLFTAAGFGLVYIAVKLVERSDEFIQWPALYAMWALSFGSWFVLRERVNWKRLMSRLARPRG